MIPEFGDISIQNVAVTTDLRQQIFSKMYLLKAKRMVGQKTPSRL